MSICQVQVSNYFISIAVWCPVSLVFPVFLSFFFRYTFAGLPAVQFARLQSVLRAAARLVLGLPGRAPVSAVMSDSLHWLSFPQRVTFKLCLMTYKCLHGLAPTYLSQCCVPVAAVTGRSRLRSADDRMLYVPRTQTVTLGPRAFSSSGPSSWNSLPPVLRDPDISLLHFRQLLKTFFV